MLRAIDFRRALGYSTNPRHEKHPLPLPTCVLTLSAVAGETNSPRPPKIRVVSPGLHEDYEILRTVSAKREKVVTVYGNTQAASVTNLAQLPYPNGSMLVMETAARSGFR